MEDAARTARVRFEPKRYITLIRSMPIQVKEEGGGHCAGTAPQKILTDDGLLALVIESSSRRLNDEMGRSLIPPEGARIEVISNRYLQG